MKVRHKIANIPIVGRYIYPTLNSYSIFSKPGKYYPFANLKKLEEFMHPKIVVFGLPKSGNTWIVSLLSDSLNLNAVHLDLEKNKSGVGMTHDPISYRLKQRKDFARGVYIIRDIRDIIVSYFHYVKTDYYKDLNDPFVMEHSIESFYRNYFLPKLIDRYDWLNHAENYVRHGLPVLRYEDLYDDPKNTLQKLFTNIGIEVSEENIDFAIDNNQLKKVKEEGKDLWHNVPSSHFRKGGYGGYKNEMSEELILQINQKFGNYLTRWGYKL